MRKIVVMAMVLCLLMTVLNYRSAPVSANGCVTPPSGMVSWWPGDGAANDQMGVNPGTMVNGATFGTGMVGQAFSLDGTNDYVDLGNYLPTNDISIDAWVNLNSTVGVYTIWGVADSSAWNSALFYIYSDALRWTIDVNSSNRRYWYGNFTFLPNQWYHVAMTQSGGPTSTPSLYVNGTSLSVTLGTTAGTPSYSSQPASIGRQGGSIYGVFDGRIDELEIYNRALSSSEIISIYNAGSAGKCKSCVSPPSNMVSWWPGDGNANDIQDSNHGTLMNGATYGAGMVGQAFSLDGTNDYVAIPNGIIPSTLRYFTVDAWVYPLDTNDRTIFYSGNVGEYSLDILGGSFRFCVNLQEGWSGKWYCALSGATSGNWVHLVGVRKDTSIELWVDGGLVSTVPTSASNLRSPGSSYNSSIGAFNRGSRYWYGLIDEVELFIRALSQTEIQSIYNAGSAGKCKPQTLTVTKVGTGYVDSNPGGIACGATCSNDFDYNTNVTLTAYPPTGFTFTGWSGDSDCSDGQVTMNTDKTCTATFTINTYVLLVTVVGNGSVTSDPTGIDCGSDCTETYNYNTSVTLAAVPDPGWVFDGWSGDCTGADCTAVMTDDRNVTAIFLNKQEANPGLLTMLNMLPAAVNNISKAKDLAKQANGFLSQAKEKNLDTAECEKLVDEATVMLGKAKLTNPIAANNYALKAIEKLKAAVDCLKTLIG